MATTLIDALTTAEWGTSTATSGSVAAFSILKTYNQASGTAANTDLLVNRTETAVGSGAQKLADFQVGGTSKLYIDNAGVITFNNDTGRQIHGNTAVAGQDAVTVDSAYLLLPQATTSISMGTVRRTWLLDDGGSVSSGLNMVNSRGVRWRNSTTTAATHTLTTRVEMVLTGTTTDATPTELTTGGTQPTLQDGDSMGFVIYVSAMRTDAAGEAAFYRVEGMVDNNSGTTALVGTVTVTTLTEDTVGWDVSVTADDTNDNINVLVTGAFGSTIAWTASINFVIAGA